MAYPTGRQREHCRKGCLGRLERGCGWVLLGGLGGVVLLAGVYIVELDKWSAPQPQDWMTADDQPRQ